MGLATWILRRARLARHRDGTALEGVVGGAPSIAHHASQPLSDGGQMLRCHRQGTPDLRGEDTLRSIFGAADFLHNLGLIEGSPIPHRCDQYRYLQWGSQKIPLANGQVD